MIDPDKKTCPFCAETMQANAKLCPHCHQWLTLKSFRHPLVVLLVHVVPITTLFVVLAVVLISQFSRLQNPKPYYSEFPSSLKILQARMNWVQTSEGQRIFLTGVLTNTAPVAWKDPEFDCRFFDAKGIMVDAGASSSYLTVRPNDDIAFRVSLVPTAPTNSYASFRVSVGNARNANAWF